MTRAAASEASRKWTLHPNSTSETVYDESYIEQKRKTLQKTVVVHERIEIPPKGHSVN